MTSPSSHRPPRWLTIVAMAIVLVVVTSSFALSFTVLRDMAMLSGIPEDVAWLWPVIVDGTIVAATLVLYTASATGRSRRLPLATLVTFALASVVGNVAHIVIVTPSSVVPVAIAVFVAVIPPVGLLLTVELLGSLLRRPQTPDKVVVAQESTEIIPTPPAGAQTVGEVPTQPSVPVAADNETVIAGAAGDDRRDMSVAPGVTTHDDLSSLTDNEIATPSDTDTDDGSNADSDDEPVVPAATRDTPVASTGQVDYSEAQSTPPLHLVAPASADLTSQVAWIVDRARNGHDVSWSTLAALLEESGHSLSDRTVQRRLERARQEAPEAFEIAS